jgi:hypothetical protein
MQVDQEKHLIQFVARFTARSIFHDPLPAGCDFRVCTADCNGAGRLYFDLEDLSAGLYTIYLGDEKAGELQIPMETKYLICLEALGP